MVVHASSVARLWVNCDYRNVAVGFVNQVIFETSLFCAVIVSNFADNHSTEAKSYMFIS